MTGAEARAEVAARLERREADFLAHMRLAVYERPGSPYRDLLRHAGVEAGDLESLVRREGVEGTLRVLLQHGVYLTVEELRGQRPIRRGTFETRVAPARLASDRGCRTSWRAPAAAAAPARRSRSISRTSGIGR